MKLTKRIVALVLCIVMCVGLVGVLASCSGEKDDENTITIKYFKGGYGEEWMNKIVEKFKAAYPEYKVEAIADAGLDGSYDSEIRGGTTPTDIYMCHNMAWQPLAAEGYLANLDDLYEMKNQDDVKFSDRIASTSLASAKFDGHYYKVHYTQGIGGIMYNVTMFEKYNWKVPTTYEELVELCEKIVTEDWDNDGEAGITVGDDIVKPFTWSGSEEQYMWDYVLYEWWAQLKGIDNITEFTKYTSAEATYGATGWSGMKEAYTLWYNLIAKHPKYSIDKAETRGKIDSQAPFKNGQAAMIPAAHWTYNEATLNSKESVKFAFMDTPLATGATMTGKVNYSVGFGDSIIVPKYTKALEGVKKFLLFLSTNESCKIFTTETNGSFLAFDYSTVDLKTLTASNSYINSAYNKLTGSTCFNIYSSTKYANDNTLFFSPWVDDGADSTRCYTNAYKDPTKYTPDKVAATVAQRAKDKWDSKK